MSERYANRLRRFLIWCEKQKAIWDGARILEVGTGWMHSESIFLRFLYDVKTVLFDVWDNRQLAGLKRYCSEIGCWIGDGLQLKAPQKERVHKVVRIVSAASCFEEIYEALGFRYVIDRTGTLSQLQDGMFDFVYSVAVLEHVDRDVICDLSKDFYRVLKPGGMCLHIIDLEDHLMRFSRARNMCQKHYLSYSEKIWRLFFENKVQYFNRIQCFEWLEIMEKTGLELVEKFTNKCNVDNIVIAKDYRHLDAHDLECKTLIVLHRKPALHPYADRSKESV